jgi:hypothetical protein
MPYDLGDTVPLAVTVRDSAGDPTAAGTCLLSVELPDGTTVQPAVSSDETGIYTVAYVPTMAGRYAIRWTSTEPATAYADVFDVRPAAPLYVLSLADARDALNITSSRHDEKIRPYIEATTGALERYLGQVIVRRTFVETITARRGGQPAVALSHWPVVSITSAATEDGVTTWDAGDLDADDVGILTGATFTGRIVVTYIAGRSEMPPEITLAARKVLAALYSDKRGASAGPPGQPGGEELERDAYGIVTSPEVVELLGASGPLTA